MNYEYCNGYTYTIKQGDTLYEISKKLEVPLALILRSNPYVDVFDLQVGDTLCIPSRERPLPPPPPGRPEPPMPDRPPMPPVPGGPPRPPAPGRPQNPSTDRPLPPLPPPPMPRMEMLEERQEGTENRQEEDAWIRYVVQPGDTIAEMVKDEELLKAVLERNGVENIYLLPGIAYYIPER